MSFYVLSRSDFSSVVSYISVTHSLIIAYVFLFIPTIELFTKYFYTLRGGHVRVSACRYFVDITAKMDGKCVEPKVQREIPIKSKNWQKSCRKLTE